MSAQLLYWKLDQKLSPRKLVFIQYLPISITAVFMFMFRSAQGVAYDAFPAAYVAVMLVTNLFRKPVRTVVL